MPGSRVDAACTKMRLSILSCTGGYDFAPLAASIAPSAIEFLPSFQYMPLNAEGPPSISPFLALRSSPPPLLIRPDMTDGSSSVKWSASFLTALGWIVAGYSIGPDSCSEHPSFPVSVCSGCGGPGDLEGSNDSDFSHASCAGCIGV